jgi:signal transduction histidine kinase
MPELDLAAALAHDVNNLAMVVLAYAELLKTCTQLERRLQMIDSITTAGNKLAEKARQALTRSRMRHTNSVPTSEPFDPSAEVADTVRLFVLPASAKKVQLSTVLDPDLPATVVGCAALVSDVLINFLTNALKYAADGGSITIRAERHESGLLFAVDDKGPGLSTKLQETLFQPFAVEPGAPSGHGFGLSQCKCLVEQTGGTIGVNSKLGEGATFFFTIPYQAA